MTSLANRELQTHNDTFYGETNLDCVLRSWKLLEYCTVSCFVFSTSLINGVRVLTLYVCKRVSTPEAIFLTFLLPHVQFHRFPMKDDFEKKSSVSLYSIACNIVGALQFDIFPMCFTSGSPRHPGGAVLSTTHQKYFFGKIWKKVSFYIYLYLMYFFSPLSSTIDDGSNSHLWCWGNCNLV